ncbi:MAG: methyltransferase domain-containing protein [Anaerolineales bacterium]|nr:methyltransferase domain-containing protein [Anaerolineales bacterium]
MLEIRHDKMDNFAATQEAYNVIYKNEGIQQRDSFYLWILHLLNLKPGSLLLDISCGQGKLIKLAQTKGMHAIGVDFALEGVLVGKADSPASQWLVGDGECLPFDNGCIDYITHIGSLEHYLNPQLGANEIFRTLKPGGKAAILLPNAFGLLGNIKYVMRTGEIFDDGQPIQRYATRAAWERILTGAGLRVVRTIDYGEVEFPRTYRDALWFFCHPRKVLRYLLSILVPFNLTNHFVYICTRDR